MIALENSLPLPQMPTYAGFIRKSQCQHSDVQEWKWWRYLDFSPSTLWLLHMLHADIPTPMESHGFCHDDELKITAERWYCGKIEGVVCSYYSGVIQTLYKSGRTPGWRRKPIGILQRLNITQSTLPVQRSSPGYRKPWIKIHLRHQHVLCASDVDVSSFRPGS